MSIATLEITISYLGLNNYSISFRLALGSDRRPISLPGDVQPTLREDLGALIQYTYYPEAYGKELARILQIGDVLKYVRNIADKEHTALHMRIHFGPIPADSYIPAMHWELLWDEDLFQFCALNGHTLFSRSLDNVYVARPRRSFCKPLDILLVSANPIDLQKYNRTDIDAAEAI